MEKNRNKEREISDWKKYGVSQVIMNRYPYLPLFISIFTLIVSLLAGR